VTRFQVAHEDWVGRLGPQPAFGALFDAAATAMFCLDLEGRVLGANAAAEALIGFTSDELRGRLFVNFLVREDIEPELIAGLAAGRVDSFRLECRYLHRDGTSRYSLCAASLVKSHDRRPLYILAVVEDITQLKIQQRFLEYQALHDSLTQLPNRLLLEDRFEQALEASQRNGKSVGVLLLDLDRFKEINDAHGHQVGDDVLQLVASNVRSVVRASDTVARLGGDEFAILQSDVPGRGAVTVMANKILGALAHPLSLGSGRPLQVTASVGIAIAPEDGVKFDALMRRADLAMYAAKSKGGGYAFASGEFRPRGEHAN
jgi:diguanylate cyclase (GGDEF)-like protein/PAS domain S-box-containing protein